MFWEQPLGKNFCRGAVYREVDDSSVANVAGFCHFPFREIREIRVEAVPHPIWLLVIH